ncbi:MULTISPECIES: hypothetical protein [Streptomyces]|uniref:Uncharacterized protein n=1 Tax=Streptomyces venezuelae (strain ATCC 10712 / CBS 650.69 / DSM 40230 / JCM 4526 / NBRC 13096 / PD 04745) TaxID=953739 RepID=F2RHM3_STRVP|nr:hypothetical protein [Streptomyces venezuelae]APE25366.1 hypothetical protein vnz_32950 [Streptomyces venezuelae]QES02705.1 hypothetical protein DEJ43_33490 [Streptomyces venezuelae ATCC 10712]CCA59967.1 hypothetical protein SVEN_6681 [Streptomyces venezuelae ATCC 10712]
MEDTRAWSDGPKGAEAADPGGGLSGLLGGPGGAARRAVTGVLVCRYCGEEQFEVTARECFCVGCCLPLGVEDGDVYGPETAWRLRPAAAPAPGTATEVLRCPAGHDLFQVAAAYTLGADGRVERLSVGLRCPADGSLRLFVDDARVEPVAG